MNYKRHNWSAPKGAQLTMKITKPEEVTRTYCDICKRDITNGNRYGYYNNSGIPVDICDNGRSFKNDKPCVEKFLFNRSLVAGDVDFN